MRGWPLSFPFSALISGIIVVYSDVPVLVHELVNRVTATQLPDCYRTVLILSDMAELKAREIAVVLDVTVEAAKIRLHRARAQLRQSLDSQCSFYRDPQNTLLCDLKG